MRLNDGQTLYRQMHASTDLSGTGGSSATIDASRMRVSATMNGSSLAGLSLGSLNMINAFSRRVRQQCNPMRV